jgi:hypothetical protein
VLDQYLVSLGSHLVGSRRDRARILDEIRSGLEEATEGRSSRGIAAAAAAQAAIDDLGSPTTLAAAFAGELATRLARRTLWTLLLTGPLVGIWWFLLFAPAPWSPQLGLLIAAIPVLPLIAAAIGTAIIAIGTTGSLIRWLPEAAPKRALSAAVVVALACIIGDLTMLLLLGFRSATGTAESFPLALAVVAITASAIRLVGSAWLIRRCLRAQVALVGAN